MRFSTWGLRAPAIVAGLFGLAMTMGASPAEAGGCGCSACVAQAAAPCGEVAYQLVERTIQVPTMVTERRVVNVTECRTETRERTITVQRVIPETKQVRDVYTVMVPQVQNRVEKYHVQVPVWREVEQNVTVNVPVQETRQGVRHVCRQVQVQEMQTVTRDLGHWDEVLVEVAHHAAPACSTPAPCGRGRRFGRSCGGCGQCGGCGSCGGGCGEVGYDAGCGPAVTQQIQRVWKPDIVSEQVPVTVWRNQMVEEAYEYQVTVCRQEVRKQKTKVCEYVTQERQREFQVTVCVPEQREAVRNVTSYRTVAEPQVQRYTVQVPVVVQKEVNVQVCRMVPKTVVCKVPVAVDCGACAPVHGGHAPCHGCGRVGCRGCR